MIQVLTARNSSVLNASANPNYRMPAFGVQSVGSTLLYVAMTVPAPCVLRNLWGFLTVAPGGTNDWTVTVMRNGVATGLSTVIKGASTSNVDVDHYARFYAGDTMAIRWQSGGPGTAASAVMAWSMQLIPDSSGWGQTYAAITNNFWGTSQDAWCGIQGQVNDYLSAIGSCESIIPGSFDLRDVYLSCPDLASGESVTLTLYKNGSATALTGTLNGPSTTLYINNSVSLAAGDYAAWKVHRSWSTADDGPITLISSVLQSTGGGGREFALCLTDDELIGNGLGALTRYNHPAGFGHGWATAEADRQGIANAFTVSRCQWACDTAPVGTASFTWTLREAAADTAITVSVPAGGTPNGFLVQNEYIANGNLIDWKFVKSFGLSSGTAGTQRLGLLCTALDRVGVRILGNTRVLGGRII